MRASSETTRWIAAVESRARRESPPALDLWNPGPKPDFAAAVARETHHAGARVRKSTTRPPPDPAQPLPGDQDEVVFHLVARAIDPQANLAGGERSSSSSSSSSSKRSDPTIASLDAIPPFLSTRADVARGRGVPARLHLTLDDIHRDPTLASSDSATPAALTFAFRRDASSSSSASATPRSAPLPEDVFVPGLTLALASLRVGERATFRISPEYAYLHPDANRRGLRPPLGVGVEDALVVDVELLRRRRAFAVRLPDEGNTHPPGCLRAPNTEKHEKPPAPECLRTRRPRATRRVVREGEGWETPRPPFEVTVAVEARVAPARHDPADDSADFDVPWKDAFVARRVVSCVSGDGTLPKALGAAVDAMRVGERCVVWASPSAATETETETTETETETETSSSERGSANADPKRNASGSADPKRNASGSSKRNASGSSSSFSFPAPPASAAMDGVEYRVELVSMVHARDVFGDGFVVKRREREGPGEFPADCPLKDCRVRVHFRARVVAHAASGETTTTRETREGVDDEREREYEYDTRADASLGGEAFSFRLGCGRVPDALETSIRLMIPGEVSRVTLTRASHERYGYAGLRRREDSPGWCALSAALSAAGPDAGLEFAVELEGFDRPVNWHRAELDDMLAEAEANRREGNQLLAAGELALAQSKYEKTYHDLDGLRGLGPEEHERVSGMKIATLLNLAAALQRRGEHARALERLRKVTDEDPDCVKALWRRAVSLAATHEYDAARENLARVVELDPSLARDVDAKLRKIREREVAELGVERRRMEGKLAEPKGAS